MGLESRGFWLRVVERDKSGYKLTGGGGGTFVDITDNPIDAGGFGNNVYGAINDKNIKLITLYYKDGKEINLDINDQDYFHYYRDDVEDAEFPYIKGFNIEGDLLFDTSNGTL